MNTRALVAGAGPAGIAAAVQLSSWCDQITIVECRSSDSLGQAGEHLPPAALVELNQLGLSDLLNDDRHTESSGVWAAWGRNEPEPKDYFVSLPGYGMNLDRNALAEKSFEHLESLGVSVMFDTQVTELTADSGTYIASLRTPAHPITRSFDIVLDATGRRASLARKLGATRTRFDHLVGLSGTVSLRQPIDDGGILYIDAMQDGWWYAIGSNNEQMICTYLTDSILVHRDTLTTEDFWLDRLRASEMLGRLVDPLRLSRPIRIFDAATQALRLAERPGFLAIGDCATAFDPLSSWGITKGMCDGYRGAATLQMAHLGDTNAVSALSRERKREFCAYMEKRQAYYMAEERWPESPFWRARQKATAYPSTRENELNATA